LQRKPTTAVRKTGAKVAARSKHRQSTYASATAQAATLGLTLLQASRVQETTLSRFCAEYADFKAWSRKRGLEPATVGELDNVGAEYLDHLFLEGYQAERGEKLIAAFQTLHPALGTASTGSLPLMRSGMRGFRKLAHGYSRAPLVLEAVYAVMGQLVASSRAEMGLALLVGWDAFLRMPSDLIRMRASSWVAPVPHLTGNRWGLLLYPEEALDRSKTAQFDESVLLDHPAVNALGTTWKAMISRAGASSPFWSFTETELVRSFTQAAAEVGLPASTVMYQIRHGAASHSALVGARSMPEIQRRLRHASAASTQRYEKHTRYLAEVGRLKPEQRAYGVWVGENLVRLLSGALPPVSFSQFRARHFARAAPSLPTTSGASRKRRRVVGKRS